MLRNIFLSFMCVGFVSLAHGKQVSNLPIQKVIKIRVQPNGTIYMDTDTLYAETLAKTLQQRLWKSYTGTGKMYLKIEIVFEGEVLMGTRGSVLDAIKQAQEKALTEVCLQKYRKTFEGLSENQKAKMRKNFPVLFQEIKW